MGKVSFVKKEENKYLTEKKKFKNLRAQTELIRFKFSLV